MTRYLEKKLAVAPPEPLEAPEGNDSGQIMAVAFR